MLSQDVRLSLFCLSVCLSLTDIMSKRLNVSVVQASRELSASWLSRVAHGNCVQTRYRFN